MRTFTTHTTVGLGQLSTEADYQVAAMEAIMQSEECAESAPQVSAMLVQKAQVFATMAQTSALKQSQELTRELMAITGRDIGNIARTQEDLLEETKRQRRA